MNVAEAEIAMVGAVMNIAMQLYVADIQKTPKEDLHLVRPLTFVMAGGYVNDALTLYSATLPKIQPLIKRKT